MLLVLAMQGPFILSVRYAVSVSDAGSIHTEHS